jgi:hypothetical protein
MYEYIYTIILFIIIGIFAFIKIQYPFWSAQPVFHSYDFWRRFSFTFFYIQNGFPIKTKFCDPKRCLSIPYSEMNDDSIKKTIDIIQCYYIPSDRVIVTMNKSGLNAIMTGHSNPSYVTFYNESDFSIEYDASGLTNILEKPLPVGCILSKPTRLFINTKGKMLEYAIYSWDYLCVHRDYIKKNISRNLIQTAEYNQRIKNPEILGTIFKKEGSICDGVVPLVEFKTFIFYLRNVKLSPLPPKFTVTRILNENVGLFSDFLYGITHPKRIIGEENAQSPFFIMSIPEMGSINAMFLSENMYAYLLQNAEHIYGLYIFKDAKINYEDVENGNLLECVFSVSNTEMDGLFFSGFLNSLRAILNLQKKYKMIMFNDLSHNAKILDKWRWKYTPVFENKAAYYAYNMVIPGMPFQANKVAII